MKKRENFRETPAHRSAKDRSQAGTKVAGKGIKYCVEGGRFSKTSAGRERILHSKGIKYCVEGGRFSKALKFCRSQNETLKDGGPANGRQSRRKRAALPRGKAREAANCSGKPGAPPAGRAPGKKFREESPGILRYAEEAGRRLTVPESRRDTSAASGRFPNGLCRKRCL